MLADSARSSVLTPRETHARAALDFWATYFPWRLLALWPMFGVSFARQQLASAASWAREILQPEQCRFTEELTEALHTGLTSFDHSDLHRTRVNFQRASDLAREEGFL
jgi:hypothetical protein